MRNPGLLAVLARFLAVTGSSIYVPGKLICSLLRIPSYQDLISGSILGRYNELRSGAWTPAQKVCCSESKLIFRAYLTGGFLLKVSPVAKRESLQQCSMKLISLMTTIWRLGIVYRRTCTYPVMNWLNDKALTKILSFGDGVCGLQAQAAIRLTFHDSIGLSKALGSSGRFG
jgi:hypothetical protein